MAYFDELKKKKDRDGSAGERLSGQKKNARGKIVLMDIRPPERALPLRPARPDVSESAARPKTPAPDASEPRPLQPQEVARDEKTPRVFSWQNADRDMPASQEGAPDEPAGMPAVKIPPAAGDLKVFTWEPESQRRRRARVKISLWAGAALLAAAFGIPTFLIPVFSVAVIPKVETVSVPETELEAQTAAAAVRADARIIPGLVVSLDKSVSREFPSTGTKFVQERARGAVEIFNAFSSAPQVLVANTRLQDSSGKVFRLAQSVSVPGAKIQEGKIVPQSAAAGVIADAAGDSHNLGPAEFRIPGFRGTPKYDGFYARSKEPFVGGYEGEAKVVLADDLRRASEELTRAASEGLAGDLDRKLPAGDDFAVPAGGREIAVASIDQPKAGDRRDRFSVTVTARGRAFLIRRSDAARVLAGILLSKNGPGLEPLPRQDMLSFGEARLQGPGDLRFKASGVLAYAREVRPDELASVLRTSTPRKAEAYLRGREEIGSFAIKRFPSWLWYIPSRPTGLKISVREAK